MAIAIVSSVASSGAKSGSASAAPTDATGAGGRTTELVVSLDGTCSASTPDVDVQPARQSDAIEKMMTPDNRIWTCTQNTTDRWQDYAAGQTSPDY
nr:thiamine biosynthesis protein ApbE [Mesorhizobium sp.]